MDAMIKVRDLSYVLNEKIILNSFHFTVKRGSWVTLLGPVGSGKSTLIKFLTGLLPSNKEIEMNGILVEPQNLREIRMLIGVVFENPNHQLIGETVMENIAFPLENLEYDRDIILTMIDEISKKLQIKNLLNRTTESLSGGEKQLVALASVLVKNPRILILDEAFTMLDEMEKNKILKILKRFNQKEGMTILNVTQDIEESIYGDEIAIIKKGKLLMQGAKESIYAHDKELKTLGFELPFMAKLSQKLKYYHLLDKTVYDMDEMVDLLWK